MASEVPEKIRFDPRTADAAYKQFPSFARWSRAAVDTIRWDRYSALLAERQAASPEILRRAREIVKRAAALDTGAIEGLYEVDRGFTFTVATEAAMWEAALQQKGEKVRSLFESQLKAYDYVLDLATKAVPIGEAWVRELHNEITKSQDTYAAYTELGIQELTLPHGQYKHLPNHVRRADGKVHSYAPVDLTPSEMHRLCDELNSTAFVTAHPVLQASYAHYAFVCIHPFADGNGRVARALASIFSYRSHGIPLMVLAENRGEYISSLESADAGTYQDFVDFTLERMLDGIRLVDESIRAATAPSVQNSIEIIKNLYVTKGGYTHEQVDQAGQQLANLFQNELNTQIQQTAASGPVSAGLNNAVRGPRIPNPPNRFPLSGRRGVSLVMSTKIPAEANVTRTFEVEVPKDGGRNDDLVLVNVDTQEKFEARLSELVPTATAALQMRLSILAERTVAEALDELAKRATSAFSARGYRG
jgi:Fic family protein